MWQNLKNCNFERLCSRLHIVWKALPHPQTFYGDHLTSAEQTIPILPEGPRSGPLLGPCVHIIKPQISSWHLGTIIAPQKHEASIRLPAVWQLIPIGHVWSEDRSCSQPENCSPQKYQRYLVTLRIWIGTSYLNKINQPLIFLFFCITNDQIPSFIHALFKFIFEMQKKLLWNLKWHHRCLWFSTAGFSHKAPLT